MNNKHVLAGLTMCLQIVASSVMASNGTDGILTALEPDNLPVVARGEQIYKTNCASCHGDQLEGQPNWRQRDEDGYLPAPPHDASGHTWHHADDLLFEITKYGPGVVISNTEYQSRMPAYANILSDEDIVAVLSFIKNTWPEQERQWQEEVNSSRIDSQLPQTKGSSRLEKLFK